MGEKLIRVKDQSPGGEMARLLLTLLTLLASKEKKPLIVFDEIDANIGGQTALTIGQKFLQLAKNRQVIAITHFAQVAIAANHHFVINKIHQNMRTLTQVRPLRGEQIKLELQRMRGE
jgi:DNA repair protein RecN (Recombination protein N)